MRTVLQIHAAEPEGDILLFLTGQEEIELACIKIREEAAKIQSTMKGPFVVLPLYSSLPPQEQQRIFGMCSIHG